jgi:hypothetical protein
VPEGARIHALEVLDHFEHADLAVPLDEGLELARDLVELFVDTRPVSTISTACALSYSL